MAISPTNSQLFCPPASWRLQVYSGAEALAQLRPAWRQLERASEGFYHSFDWHQALAEHLLPDEALEYWLLQSHDDPLAILPLQRRQLGPIALRQSPSHGHISLSGWLLHPRLSRAQFARYLRAQWHHLPAPAPHALGLYHTLADPPGTAMPQGLWREVGQSAFFDTRQSDMAQLVAGKMRRSLKSKRKRVAAPITFQQVTAEAALNEAYERFLEVESSGWKQAEGSAIAQAPKLRAFYAQLLQRFAERQAAAVNTLYFGDECVAAQLALRSGREWSILKIGYRESHAAHSPGGLLLQSVLQHCLDDPSCHRLSLTTAPEWCHRWHPQYQTVGHLHLFRPSVAGAALRCMETLKQKTRS